MKGRWHKIIGVGLGLLVLAGLVGGSMALAQGPQDEPPRLGGPRRPRWHGLCFIEVTAQELGLEMEALIERLRDGESLSDIAAEQGKALRDLTDAFLSAQDEALTEAADQGYFTPARADWGQQRLHQRTEQFLAGFGWRHGLLAPVGLEAAAEVLGMTKEELRDELREGKTIAGLAERQGVELESISEALQAAREEALTRAVEEGYITPEQADRIRQRVQRRTERCLLRLGPRDCPECFAPHRGQLRPHRALPAGPPFRGMPHRW